MTLRIIAAAVLAFAYPAAVAGQEKTPAQNALEEILAEPRFVLSTKTELTLRKENPDQLYVSYDQYGDCPFSEQSIVSMIDGLLVRSRLKPISEKEWRNSDSTWFHLKVVVGCDDDNKAPYIFDVSTRFCEEVTLQKPGERIRVFMEHIQGYGAWGTFNPDTDYLRNAIRESVEDALTDYLKANFDL